MAVNKVNFGDRTVIDISDTTATEANVESGKTFYLANGEKAVGTSPVLDILATVSVLAVSQGILTVDGGTPIKVIKPNFITAKEVDKKIEAIPVVTYNAATALNDGLMTAEDKKKLDILYDLFINHRFLVVDTASNENS